MLFAVQDTSKGVKGQLNSVDDDTSPDLWHKRLAHMSEKGLQIFG